MTYTNAPCGSPEFADAMEKIGLENLDKGDYDRLTPLELALVLELLRGRPERTCTAPIIFGLFWSRIKNTKRLGIRFSAAIEAGQVPHVCS